MVPTEKPPGIAVFGLGYVGCVSAACFAERGHEVVGVDVSADKVAMVSAGRTPIVEERIGELISEVVASGRLRATISAAEAVASTDIALVCVGTPSDSNGGISTIFVERVAEEIGAAMASLEGRRYTVIIRSTMLPGTCEERVIPILEKASGLQAGWDFGIAVNPEFLREGSSVLDFHNPPKTVVGALDDVSGDTVASIYEGMPGPVYRVPIRVAEMTKYVDNGFHALKVGFANEIGAVCRALGIDSHSVMDIFRADTKLNISPAYLQPGYAFGGSCLPKDLRALLHAARHNDVDVPILSNVLPSNERTVDRAFRLIEAASNRRVGLFGLSFKPGTDDLRESPLVELAERLVGRGYEVLIYDAHVALSRLQGANRAFIAERIPHLEHLLASSADAVVAHGDTVVVGNANPEVLAALDRAQPRTIIDLVRFAGSDRFESLESYFGIAW
ncbi:nucleotide sugar dehydrogenase [Nakamurella sp. GG22]